MHIDPLEMTSPMNLFGGDNARYFTISCDHTNRIRSFGNHTTTQRLARRLDDGC
jgi:hypothetical protein